MKRSQMCVDRVRRGSRRRAAAAARLTAAVAAVGVASSAVRATTYIFESPGNLATPPNTVVDGDGPWDTSTANWYNTATANLGPWGNTTADTAVFGQGGQGGNVTVGAVTAGAIQFNPVVSILPGYMLNGGTITLGGPATISLNVSSAASFTTGGGAAAPGGTFVQPTINSVITGTSGLLVTGNSSQTNGAQSVLTLAGANTYTGVHQHLRRRPPSARPPCRPSGRPAAAWATPAGSSSTGPSAPRTPSPRSNSGAELVYTGPSMTTDRPFTFGGKRAERVSTSAPPPPS